MLDDDAKGDSDADRIDDDWVDDVDGPALDVGGWGKGKGRVEVGLELALNGGTSDIY